ncbi:MAG TPA: helix-turn-helix domain-containing protein [Candidatus Angelobacter sp.]|nr:helix-turn-helix domain-containing protein [Candidatus Angelobacter sp.]
MLKIRYAQEVCTRAGVIKKEPRVLLPLSYTLDEAASITGYSKRTIRRFVKRGLLRPSKASRCFIFSRAELERFLKETTND